MCHPILALTPKEREAIALVREGLSNHEISEIMNVNRRTIETHLYNASYKLNARNRIELVLILDGRLTAKTEVKLSYLNKKKLLKAKIKKLHKQGCNTVQMSERLGIGREAVRTHLVNMGLPRQRCKRKIAKSEVL